MRILIRAQDVSGAHAAQESLAAAGFEAQAVIGPTTAPSEAEDLLLVVARDRVGADALARAIPRGHRLALARAATLDAPCAATLEADAAFDAAIALDAPPVQLRRQIDAVMRMGAAEEERARRRLTGVALGAIAPETQPPAGFTALYIGAPSAFYLSFERAVATLGGRLTAAFSSYAGFDRLHDERFDAVALNAAADPAMALSLCAALRRNSNLASIPTLVAVAPDDSATRQTALERGAAAVLSVESDSDAAALGWLIEAVRQERRRSDADRENRALRDLLGDPRTGLFRSAAFSRHIDLMAEAHHASGRPMAIAALKVLPAHGARQPPEAVWRKGFTEIATLAGRLLRDVDCGATLAGDVIALALPGADMKRGRRVAERIASVGECTAFASGEDGGGPLVFEQSVVELAPGESGAGLLARGRAPYDAARLQA